MKNLGRIFFHSINLKILLTLYCIFSWQKDAYTIFFLLQEKLVWKDFNIVNEADGVQKPVVRHFNTSVTDNTLEIRFYWAGKGTTRIPVRGNYGPLISAISLKPSKFPQPSSSKGEWQSISNFILSLGFFLCNILCI